MQRGTSALVPPIPGGLQHCFATRDERSLDSCKVRVLPEIGLGSLELRVVMGDRSGNGKKWYLDWMGKDVKTGGLIHREMAVVSWTSKLSQACLQGESFLHVLFRLPSLLLTVSILCPPCPDNLEPVKNLAEAYSRAGQGARICAFQGRQEMSLHPLSGPAKIWRVLFDFVMSLVLLYNTYYQILTVSVSNVPCACPPLTCIQVSPTAHLEVA